MRGLFLGEYSWGWGKWIKIQNQNQPVARHGALGFPSQPSKIFIYWIYQMIWHVFEAVI
jgi:hypothetical protein